MNYDDEKRPPLIGRRELLAKAGVGAFGLLSGGLGAILPAAAKQRQAKGPVLSLDIACERDTWPIFPGAETFVERVEMSVREGDASKLRAIPGSFAGPTIWVNKGDTVRARMVNNLYQPTILHWHGLVTDEHNDGLPNDAVARGESYDYDFTVGNRAGTYWYHPHPDHYTGPQSYYGMSGIFVVCDRHEQSLSLPRGEYDLPLMIADKLVDANNQLQYGSNPFVGTIGDQVFINGRPDFTISAATRVYRLRLVNGSNARLYKLVWSNDLPLTVIGTDGGLLERPVQKPYVMLGPGQRIELWADFSDLPLGESFKLRSLAFEGTAVGFEGSGIQNGTPIDVFSVRIDRQEPETLTLPTTLAQIQRYDKASAVNASHPRNFPITFDGGFYFNHLTYEPGVVSKHEVVENNTLECWEFSNRTGNIGIVHPIHIHGQSFQIYDRQILPEYRDAWEGVREGYVDEGWLDTFMLMPGESAQLLLRFGPFKGLSLYHCHNLDHEDMGMMRHYRVR
jgi:FtsP/CotA-like multicopper oxidase with cupredoxin domain